MRHCLLQHHHVSGTSHRAAHRHAALIFMLATYKNITPVQNKYTCRCQSYIGLRQPSPGAAKHRASECLTVLGGFFAWLLEPGVLLTVAFTYICCDTDTILYQAELAKSRYCRTQIQTVSWCSAVSWLCCYSLAVLLAVGFTCRCCCIHTCVATLGMLLFLPR